MAIESFKNAVRGAKAALGEFRDRAQQVVDYVKQPKTYSWTGKSADQMSTLEKVGYLRSLGNQNTSARDAFTALSREIQTVGSKHYSPYLTNTSNQKEAMEFFGVKSFDQNWLDENRFLLGYVSQLDWTDTVSTSGQAKWSDAQRAGYYYQMLTEAEQTTKQAESEWASLRSAMQQNFREYKRLYGEAPSYDQLMSYIDMGDYSTLQKMDKVYGNVEDLVRLNRPVNYTPETVLGVYAALRSGKDVTGGDGNYFEDAVQYTMRPTNPYPSWDKEEEKTDYSGWTDQQAEAKRQEIRQTGTRADLARFEAELYASKPHLDSVDSESYFADAYHDEAFFRKHAYLDEYVEHLRNKDGKIEKPTAGDPWWYGAAYEYSQIKEREEATKKAEAEWASLRKELQDYYVEGSDPKITLAAIEWDDYPTLKKLREGKEVELNRAVYFSDEALMGVLRASADGEKADNDDYDYAFYQSRPEQEMKAGEQTEEKSEEQKAEAADSGLPSAYFSGPSAYGGVIGGDEDDGNNPSGISGTPEQIARDPGAGIGRKEGEQGGSGLTPEQQLAAEMALSVATRPVYRNGLEQPTRNSDVSDAGFIGPMPDDGIGQMQPADSLFKEIQPPEAPETIAEQRQGFIERLWGHVTQRTNSEAVMIEKAFYEANGRPMTMEERIAAGLAPLPKESYVPGSIQLGVMNMPKQSIFSEKLNTLAARYTNPETGKAYENMDQLIANDPALLSNMLDYIEAEPQQTEFSTVETEHLNLLRTYQDELERGALDSLFAAYADDNAVEEDRLNASLQYIIETGLTLEEKDALGLLNRDEDTQLVAERADELFVEHGSEMTRAMAISFLGTDAAESDIRILDAAISHIFAVETGVAGGLLKTQTAGFSFIRDVWSLAAAPLYAERLGEDYTLDQACEIDPFLRGLTAAANKANALVSISAPDMSNYNYGAGVTRFLVESAVSQKAHSFYAPVGQGFVDKLLKRQGLGGLGEMLASDSKFKRIFGKILNSASGATPWMISSMSDGAQEARDMGASEQDAVRYGAYKAGTTGLIEGALGQAYDGLLDKSGSLISKGLSKLTKGGMDKVLQRKGVNYMMNLFQQALGESLEEAAELPLDKYGRSIHLGEAAKYTGEDFGEMWKSMKMSFVSSLFTSVFFGMSADSKTRIYAESEQLLEKLETGRITADELMEYRMLLTEAEGGTPSDLSKISHMMPEERSGLAYDEEYEMEYNEDTDFKRSFDDDWEEYSKQHLRKTGRIIKKTDEQWDRFGGISPHDVMEFNPSEYEQTEIWRPKEDASAGQPEKADEKVNREYPELAADEEYEMEYDEEYDPFYDADDPEEYERQHLRKTGRIIKKEQRTAMTAEEQAAYDRSWQEFQAAAEADERRRAEERLNRPEVREAVRAMDELQAEMDKAAVEIAAEEVVRQQIEAGAMDDIVGEASTNAKTIRQQEAEAERLQMEVDQHAQRVEQIDQQKEAALDAIISSGLSPEQGAARQTVHNLDEARAAEQRKQEETQQKLAEKQQILELEREHIRAQVEQREKELKAAAVEQKQAELEKSRKASDNDYAQRAAEMKKLIQEQEAITPEKAPARMRSDVKSFDGAIDQIIWGEDDVYAPFSAQSKAADNRDEGSIWDAYDEEEQLDRKNPESADDMKTDDYVEISEGEYRDFEQQLKMLADNDVYISGEHLRTRSEGDEKNDLVYEMTEGEYATVATSSDGRYILVVKSGEWNRYRNRLNERNEMTDYERRQNKKPDTPKYTYRIIDTAKMSAFEAEGEQRFEVADIVGRIKTRLTDLKQQDAEGNKEQIRSLAKLLHAAHKGEDRRFITAIQKIIRENDLNKTVTGELKAALGDLYEAYAEQIEMSRYDNYTKEQMENLRESDPEKYQRIVEYDKRNQAAAKSGRNGTRNRLAEISIGVFSNKNQAMDELKRLAGGVSENKRNSVYYATQSLIDALADVDAYFIENENDVQMDMPSFIENHPGVFFSRSEHKTGWDQEAADTRKKAPYKSRLSSANDKYIAIDRADGFNLVVAKKDTRLDARQTGDVRVNPNINSVSDAKKAVQHCLDEAFRLMKQQAGVHDQKKLSENQKKYYQAMVIYSVADDDGNLVNRSFYEYTDPETGAKKMPTAEDLMAISERITVNFTAYDHYYPQKVEHRQGNKVTQREQMVPYREGGQDQYRFTLEGVHLAPDAVVQSKTDTGADRYESPEEANAVGDLRRAEAEYTAYVGKKASADVRLTYFANLCDAYYEYYAERAMKLSRRAEEAGLVDEEIASIRQQITSCQKSMGIWRYIGDRASEAKAEQNPDALKAVMKKYDALIKEGGNASMSARMDLTATMLRSMSRVRLNQLKASIPADATIKTLMAEDQRLQEALEEVMNARNQAAVQNHQNVSSIHSEPLAQAIMEEQDAVRQQMEIAPAAIETEPELQSGKPEPEAETPTEPEVYAGDMPENGAEKLTGDVSENAGNQTEMTAEENDPVMKQQEMDRAYLEAVMDEDFDAWDDNESLEAYENQAEQPEYIDMETGEYVRSAEEITGGEYADAETGEIYSEEPAEDLSYATPVEEYMERAGLNKDFPATAIVDAATHEQTEELANSAYQAVKGLTDRINTIQTVLQSGVLDEELTAAVQAEKQRYIDERNRIKAQAKVYDKALGESKYLGSRSINNVVRHCLETGDIDWESPLIRSKQIDELRKQEINGIRKRLADKLGGDSLKTLSLSDVCEIIGSETIERVMYQRNQVAWALRNQLKTISEEIADYEEQAASIRKQNEQEGESPERMIQLARIDEYLNRARSMMENGQKSMRMFFDSGSGIRLENVLKGTEGGKLPLPVMNHIFAMLQESETTRKSSTNRVGILNNIDNPLRTMEFFTGEFAPIFNAIYINPVQEANARMAAEMDDIVGRLEEAAVTAKNEEIVFKYAEGKLNEVELEDLVSDPHERARIAYAAEVYREVYDRLFEEVNAALKRNGFEEIRHRNNYIHHMSDAQGVIAQACSKLGIHIAEDSLPASMAGKTEELKPRRKFMSASMERHGDETSYKLRRNTMNYVQSALRVIHQTDNLSRLRQLEGISGETQNKAAVYSGVRQYGDLTVSREGTIDRRQQAYSSMAAWISRYADGIAGKKVGTLDRALEGSLGRNALQVVNAIKRYSGASVTAYNLGVASSNMLTVTTMGSIAPKQTGAALLETISAFRDNEWLDFEAKSSFLTSRFHGKGMNLTWMDKFMEKGYVAAEAVDRFAAHTVVRAFYKIGRDKGWTDGEAIRWADNMALRMMSSRNIGEGSNTMNTTISSAILQFSREGINNIQFLMKDLPRYHNDDKKTWMSLLLVMISNFLYNGMFSKDTAPELITPTIRSKREWDPEKDFMQNVKNTVGNYAEMLNPTNLGTGGAYGEGILEGIPSVSAVKDLVTSDDSDDFLSAALGFIPGGRAGERIVTDVNDMFRGYSVNKDGNIKYVLRTDEFSAGSVFDVLATTLFGSGSSIGGRAYKAGGYQSMTKTQTEAFHSEKATGMSNREAFNSVNGYAEQKGDRNASAMVLPDWAAKQADTEWMQEVRAYGTGAYPSKAPEQISINGADHRLTDEEKSRFDVIHAQIYQQRIRKAIAEGKPLHIAAEGAYSTAKKILIDEMEG